MKDFPDYYPPSPRKVPQDLTEPSVPFRKQINLVSFSLLLFFVLYFGLILLLVIGIVLCLATKATPDNAWNVARFIVALVLLVPVVILVKNLFGKKDMTKGYEVEIFAEDHPRLFRFLECICAETGAPMPERVLVNFEVNAAAGAEVSLATLFGKPKQYLILGMGLLNVLNMTEFKALLAHEFGHFSQQNMKSGPYVRMAMQLIFNIINGTKLAGLNHLLMAMFVFVLKLHYALGREMEFHADLVASSVAGSDAIPQLLFKCYWAEACLQRAASDLDTAREHNLFSRDVFLHQHRAGKYLRKALKNPDLGEPPLLLPDRKHTFQLFRPDEDEVAEMWATHPSNFERELNTKSTYIRTDFDDSSPWMLFDDRLTLRKEVSAQFYRAVFRVKPSSVKWNHPQQVQAFLDDEYAETIFDMDRYGLLYNNRDLQAMDLRALRSISEENLHTPAELVASHRSMYTEAVKKFADVFQRHVEELQMLSAIKNRWFRPKRGRFELRGSRFRVNEAKSLLRDVEKDLNADFEWLTAFDVKVFVTYFEIALLLDEPLAEELYQRYRFHFVLQGMWSSMGQHRMPMDAMFNFVATLIEGAATIDDDLFHVMIEIFREAYASVKKVLDEAELLTFPQLANMPAGEPVRPFLMKGGLVKKPTHYDESFSTKWMDDFSKQFHEVLKRLNRLHFKSLGNILALQEGLGQRAEKKWKPAAPRPKTQNDG